MDGRVTLEVAGGVAVLTLDRPAKHNAITNAMAAELADHARRIDAEDAVRAVLLRGAGDRAFCAGMDLKAIEAFPTPWDFRHRPDYPGAVRGIRKPVVAALRDGRWAAGSSWRSPPTCASLPGPRASASPR
jgi:enoyl-CoA hydratase/carnithine racemase